MREIKLSQSEINRRKSRIIHVGNVPIGGDSLYLSKHDNTLTKDVKETIKQIKDLEKVGADLIRISVPDADSVTAFKEIKKSSNVPLIADIHFDYKLFLKLQIVELIA